VPLLLTPFSHILEAGSDSSTTVLLRNIQVLFVVELIQRLLLQIIGLPGILSRHILGPCSIDQRRMNLHFSGEKYNIGEQYTEITKILLLTVFYSTLYPLGFFFAAAVFASYYWVDKFCVLRSWSQGARIGTAISDLSAFFFKLCALAYAVMAMYSYVQFLYNNACCLEEGGDPASLQDAYDKAGLSLDITLRNGDVETVQNYGSAAKVVYKLMIQYKGIIVT